MKSFVGMSVIGLVGGFLVGITSVGSGSIIMMMLLVFYSFVPKVMVGTDITHAVILTGVTSLSSLADGQCGFQPRRIPADRLDPGRNPGIPLEHARPCGLVAENSVYSSVDDRRKNAVGVRQDPGYQYPVASWTQTSLKELDGYWGLVTGY